jgi:hypothetical protein
VAHNTVVIDEKDQVSKERAGEVLHFKTSGHVKMMEMSSKAYPETKLYRRTSALIDHGDGNNYVVDFFRVEGGNKQDYVFHVIESSCLIQDIELKPYSEGGLYDFNNVRAADGNMIWRAVWKSGPAMNCVAWSVGQSGETVFTADGWGQRDWKNSDIGATIPYIVRRCMGSGIKTFISVFEGYEGMTPFVRKISLIDPSGIIMIETLNGIDYVMAMEGSGILRVGKKQNSKTLTGHFAAASVQNGKPAWSVSIPESCKLHN